MTTAIVTFDSIEKSYSQTIALRDVSFDVQAGEIFGLLGPNGAGKSTLIRILMDIIRADKGRVLVFGSLIRYTPGTEVGFRSQSSPLSRKPRRVSVISLAE